VTGVLDTIDVRRASSRFHTRTAWLDSWHSFSFGPHYDIDNTHHGLLLVSNDDRVQPGTGFGTHRHRDMEIVTWVLAGQLTHEDSEGNHGLLYPGLAQRMSAGTGIEHSEINASDTDEVRLIQMWVPPDEAGLHPGYEQLDINDELAKGGLHAIASGQGHAGAIRIQQRDAVLWGARLHPREQVVVPDGARVHVFVAVGAAALSSGDQLDEGDTARLTDATSLRLIAGDAGAETLVWVTA
jgi:redox-sensitive bicupin YhaK (pirin superfamily)